MINIYMIIYIYIWYYIYAYIIHIYIYTYIYIYIYIYIARTPQASPKRPSKKNIHIYIYTVSGWWFGTWILFFHILGISSPQLTLTPSFFGGVGFFPPTRYIYIYNILYIICGMGGSSTKFAEVCVCRWRWISLVSRASMRVVCDARKIMGE